MKKKIIIALLIVALLPSAIFASSDILQLGLNVGYKPTFSQISGGEVGDEVWDYFEWEYFTFAPEVKLNLFFIDLDALAFFNFAEGRTLIDTQLAADLYLKLAFVKLSAGAGVSLPFLYDSRGWTINDVPVDGDAFLNANLNYRLGVGFDFGRFNLMTNYIVPTKGTFKNPDFAPNLESGSFSLGLLFDLF